MAAQQPDISSLLAALAAQRTAGTPSHPPAAAPSAIPQAYPGSLPTPTQSGAIPGYSLPQPTNSGSLDLSSIKPVNTGSVSLADAVAKARGIAAEKGVAYESGRSSAGSGRDPRLSGRSYRRSRSRSRSPPRRDQFRDNYNPYRDERRDDPRRGDGSRRSRSRSPPRGRAPFSPQRDFSGGRNRSPARGGDENSELILIDSALVGLVIGRQGENLRRVEQDTGTRIQFVTGPESSGPQRQCRISGPPRARIDAKREINRIIDENGGNPVKEVSAASPANRNAGRPKDGSNHPALREGENSIQIMVPDRTVGLIIGRGGETIRDLQERSGCHVNIVGENKSVNGLRPVNLIGSKESADHAKNLIMEIVESDTRTHGGPPQGQGGQGGQGLQGGQGGQGGRNYDSYQGGSGGPSGGDKINDKIVVPSDAVGMIIGKGGETIKDMQNFTSCKINVTPPSNPDVEREIGLIGTRQAIDAAKRAIWEKVDSVRNRDGGGGYNRGGRGGRDSSDHYNGSTQGQYSQPQQQQQPYGQQPMAQPPMPAAAAQGDANAADPYAIYGGYQAYLAMWYAAMAQQKQAGQAPGQGAPGAPGI
ncbi:hypothetical protein NA57DRAFT_58745 [Rhizodiscina lignyota]|uniref:K Homology domain-containing protein n=1 Tax=Rhizodiscina lignyota TaxID=1504668 RepID=A0A9P4I8A5_9PEZI|nr:hypothetical protein NA57DRAFT_58745 [Rhizodiscina lignyota]